LLKTKTYSSTGLAVYNKIEDGEGVSFERFNTLLVGKSVELNGVEKNNNKKQKTPYFMNKNLTFSLDQNKTCKL